MPEFDVITEERTVGDLLRDSLEDAEAQLRAQRRRARRAERRTRDLSRAVENWQELINDYGRAGSSPVEHRSN